MISPEVQFRFVTDQITDRLKRATDALKFFVQTFSAITGGSIYLAIGNQVAPNMREKFIALSDLIVTLLTAVCSIIVLEALRGWYGYRQAQSDLGSGPIKLLAGSAMG